MEIIRCTNCKEPLEEDVDFCTQCGAPVKKIISQNKTNNNNLSQSENLNLQKIPFPLNKVLWGLVIVVVMFFVGKSLFFKKILLK